MKAEASGSRRESEKRHHGRAGLRRSLAIRARKIRKHFRAILIDVLGFERSFAARCCNQLRVPPGATYWKCRLYVVVLTNRSPKPPRGIPAIGSRVMRTSNFAIKAFSASSPHTRHALTDPPYGMSWRAKVISKPSQPRCKMLNVPAIISFRIEEHADRAQSSRRNFEGKDRAVSK